jgi:hypothetical protein
MRRLLCFLLVSTACLAQSEQFVREYCHGLEQNRPGLKLTFETADRRSNYRLSDVIRFKFTFTSQSARVYTIDTAVGGNAATTSADFIIDGPGLRAPIHSEPIDPRGYVCCDSRRHYLARSPVSLSDRGIALINLALFGGGMRVPPLRRYELKPGEYVVFVQTRNVMQGWPKSPHDAYQHLAALL